MSWAWAGISAEVWPLTGDALWLSPCWGLPAGFCTAWKSAGLLQNHEGLTLLGRMKEAAWATLKQVHGAEIKKAEGLERWKSTCLGEGDGLWTEQPGAVLAIQTADCVPLLLKDSHTRRVAALHAGWRGVWARILWEQLNVWTAAGSALEHIEIAIGPHIGPCCYEVGEEMAAQFSGRWPEGVVAQRAKEAAAAGEAAEPTHTVDLGKALVLDAVAFGLPPANLKVARTCTSCDMRFHSHRREKGKAGRQLTWIQCAF